MDAIVRVRLIQLGGARPSASALLSHRLGYGMGVPEGRECRHHWRHPQGQLSGGRRLERGGAVSASRQPPECRHFLLTPDPFPRWPCERRSP
jgi:hypothetical protein